MKLIRYLIILMFFIGNSCLPAHSDGPSIDETVAAIHSIVTECTVRWTREGHKKYKWLRSDMKNNHTLTCQDVTYLDGQLIFNYHYNTEYVNSNMDDEDGNFTETIDVAGLNLLSATFEDFRNSPDNLGYDNIHDDKPVLTLKCTNDLNCASDGNTMVNQIDIIVCDRVHAVRLTNALQHLHDLLPKNKAAAF